MAEFIGPDRTIEEMMSQFAEATGEDTFGSVFSGLRITERAVFLGELLVGSPADQVEEFVANLHAQGSAELAEALQQRLAA
jgi:hypothetical protein